MYVVKDGNGNVVLIATRKEDADAYLSTDLDDTEYTIEEIKT